MVKKRIKGGESTPSISVSKQEVLQDPKIREAFKSYVAQQGGGARMKGAGWWSDFVGWLKRNKVISTASKIGSVIAGATGFLPLSTALGTVSSVSSTMGYGKKMKMKGGAYPNIPGLSASPVILKF